MKRSLLLLLLLAFVSLRLSAQRTEQFGKFTDKDGYAIKGESLERGYERQLQIQSLQLVTNKQTIVRITIPNTPAVASFQAIVNSKFALQTGEIAILNVLPDRKVLKQKIIMASIKVNAVTVTDESAIIELIPATFNQSYYTTDRNGRLMEVKN